MTKYTTAKFFAISSLVIASGVAVGAPAASSKGVCLEGGAHGTLVPGVTSKADCEKKGASFTWDTHDHGKKSALSQGPVKAHK